MLQAIRERAQSWIAWVIVSLIILTFALFGIEQYAQGEKTIVVAEVNGEDISANDFMALYSRQKNRLQTQLGEMYDQVVKDEELRDQVMDALIESKVIQQWAESHNMLVSDEQLAMSIQSAPVFQKDGKFDEATYKEILLRNGLNVARFEYEQRNFLIENQNRQLTLASVFSTNAQAKQLAELQFQQRKMNYLRVDKRPFMEKAQITPEQIQAYYDENQAEFVEPEKVKIDYVKLSQDDLSKKVVVTDEALEAFYEDNKDQFTDPEQRQASHILIRIETEAQESEAQEKIAEIQKKLAEGADFAELAKENSQDPGSASLGGDLGMFQQGMMVPEFDKAVFSMNVGEVSEPVKTEFGFHLIKLMKIQPKKTQPYEDVKTEVEQQFRMVEAEKEFFDLLEKLNTTAYEQSDSLQPAADVVGLEIKTSEAFSDIGGGDEVTSNPKVIAAAFSEDVKKSGLNSAVIELSPTVSVVVRLNEVIPQREKPLDEVKASIEQKLKRKQSIDESYKLAQQLLEKLNAGETMATLEAPGVEYYSTDWLSRENREVLPQITQALFKAPKPSADKPSYSLYQLPTGDSLVIQVVEVKKGQMPDNPELVNQIKQTVMQIMGDAEVEARVQAMVADAEVVRKDIYKTLK